MIAKFICAGQHVYEAGIEDVPAVGESVMLVNLGYDEGAEYRVLKREWKLVPYAGFDNKTYTNTEVYLYVEME